MPVAPVEKTMKSKHGLVVMCLVALSAFVMAQSSVDGTWAAEVQGGRGTQNLTITLKADGGKLTGSVGGGRGGPVNIDEGTISGSDLKFKTKQQGRGGEIVLTWTGTLKGDEIAFTRGMDGGQGQTQQFTAKRQK
jgi:hypothetical protein